MDSTLIRLADYRPPAWRVRHVELEFDLDAQRTEVYAELQLEPDPQQPIVPLRLDGEELELLSIAIDGTPLPSERYRVDDSGLTIIGVHAACRLQTRVRIAPDRNTRLEGLYVSGPMLLTQCEAEGFRRITYFIDRPDNLATYAVTLRADRRRYPVLLSNGNPAGTGELADGRHFARWVDPFPKPSYLFAIAAGDIGCVEAPFHTFEGREVLVRVWAEHQDVPRCRFALEAALRAMRWDEERFGRGYDLDQYNIVAAQDFTMGAMENKGLNIFNARYVLAHPDSATDADYEGIESVIGHEYFHNWSGNRVTLRDWFQLSLKEGLTVFRDQEFTSDIYSRGVKRIEDVRLLRARQFIEDSGPLAHPVRPPEYREINNFYTATVYEKGAEVIRMLHTLLGESDFRAGLDLYFERRDGMAATVEDLLTAMSDASGRDLSQFKRWYEQAGTPEITICDHVEDGDYILEIEQRTPPTPGQPEKLPLHVPLAYALYDEQGRAILAAPEGDAEHHPGLIELTRPHHRLRFRGLAAKPLPAFGQALSAPVRIHYDYTPAQLARLIGVESDALLRWDATQRLAADAILRRDAASRAALVDACGVLLEQRQADAAFVAECLLLPDLWTLADQCAAIDLDGLIKEREDLLDELAETHADRLETRCRELVEVGPHHSLEPAAAGARRLKNVCLDWLTRLDPKGERAAQQFASAQNMTDRLAALAALIRYDAPAGQPALAEFRTRWREDPLVTDKWIGLVATRPQPEALDDIRALLADPIWQPKNPNRVRALLGNLARNNPVALHRRDDAGYALLFAQIAELDAINPQVAARLLSAFEPWQRFDAERRGLIAAHLRRLDDGKRSRDVADLLVRLLAAG